MRFFIAGRSVIARISLAASMIFCISIAPFTQVDARQGAARILIVSEHDSNLFAVQKVIERLKRELAETKPTAVEFYIEHLDFIRFPGSAHRKRIARLMAAKYGDAPIDIAIAIGPAGLSFLLENRQAIAPDVPVIAGGFSWSSVEISSLPDGVYGVASNLDVSKTVDLALRLQPDAKKIVLLTGSSDFDRIWKETARQDLSENYRGVSVEYLSSMTLDGFKQAVKNLPEDTILLILTVFKAADGRTYIPRDVTAELAAISAAPVYAVYSSYIGTGAVGGFIETFEGIGTDIANMANRILSGSSPKERFVTSSGLPVVDWRQFARWGMDETLLPENALVLHREPSIWDRYRFQVMAILAVLVLQSGTIAALIVLDRRKRRIEKELALERLELAHLSRTSQLGELSGSFAHELNQPLTSILANAEAGIRLVDRKKPDLKEIRSILEDIASSDRRAAGVIKHLRQMMLKGEVTLEPMDLNDAVSSTLALLQGELVARQTKVRFIRNAENLPVKGNMAQLQQVVLNLTLNAADAMADLAPADRRIEIETNITANRSRMLSISDRGSGLSAELREAAFRPFVSGKANGMGLGLAICRSIAEAHGGILKFDDQAAEGTRIILTLPSTNGARAGWQ
ncbi:histidine kinase [Rhizobiales bacterium]|uniref:sensor histidine kinase n=1 Tax=Hongsoonwoonella zoysiae TaxID=2821844 RepID=UPI001560275D|nr:ABC transporter substrate binding protein [Hongsoonwoonella zoysiae]NRG19122.1 histidine kinase [Hongsoonwoonella zoysiae]